MLPNAKTVDFVLLKMTMCYVTCPRRIIMRVVDMTDCSKSEKIKDHEGSKFYLRKTVTWPLCLRHNILRHEQGIFHNNTNVREK